MENITKYWNDATKIQKQIAVFIFAGVMAWLLVSARAAGPFSSLELEYGTVSSPASLVNDPLASGGSYVLFGSSSGEVASRIQAEDYTDGGEGVAYHDTTSGNLYSCTLRNDDVDIKNTSDSGGGCMVGHFAGGEWLKYSINVETAGNYVLTARVASGLNDGSSFSVDLNGADVSGTVNVPYVGNWDTDFDTIGNVVINLPAGSHTLTINSDDFFDLNWFELSGPGNVTVEEGTTPPPPPPDSDGDGVPDSQDNCPNEWGPASNNGCPVTGGGGEGRRDSIIPVWYTAWHLPWRSTTDQLEIYFGHLDQIGVTGVTVMLLPTDNHLATQNVNGNSAGSGGYNNQITLNQAYFDDFRAMLDVAYNYNIKLAPVVAWGYEYVTSGIVNTGNAHGLGLQLGQMLGDHQAIEWWIMGGDMYAGVGSPDVWAELVRGLRDGGADQRTGYHNPGGGFNHINESWNKVQLYQTGHCGPVNTSDLQSNINNVPSDSLAGQGEPGYYNLNNSGVGCSPSFVVDADDVRQSVQASLDAGADFHVYGDAAHVRWGGCSWSGFCNGWSDVQASLGNAGEQAWVDIMYPN